VTGLAATPVVVTALVIAASMVLLAVLSKYTLQMKQVSTAIEFVSLSAETGSEAELRAARRELTDALDRLAEPSTLVRCGVTLARI